MTLCGHYANHMLWPVQSPALHSTKILQEQTCQPVLYSSNIKTENILNKNVLQTPMRLQGQVILYVFQQLTVVTSLGHFMSAFPSPQICISTSLNPLL